MKENERRTDADLIELSKQNPEMFGFLMERYQLQLFHYIRRIGQFAQEDVEDLLQEVFIKIYQKLNEYEENLKFSSWAYRIAHNHVIDHFRKTNARPKTNALDEEEWGKLIAASVQMEKAVMDKDCAQKVKRVIAQLPIKYKEVLVLRFIEEKEYEEIMDILRKPKGTVATLISRGKKVLLEKLKEEKINCF